MSGRWNRDLKKASAVLLALAMGTAALPNTLPACAAEETIVSTEAVGNQEAAAETKEERKSQIIIASPYTGRAADISEAPDEGFASGMIGPGAFVELTEPDIVAPADGTVVFVFETKHALGFKTADGASLLLHVGIDTVKLNGEGFEVFVQAGDEVKKGDLMIRVDLDYVRENAPSLASPVIFTETDDGDRIELLHSGSVRAGEDLLVLNREV